jgi:small subunit ribosomal protein S3
MGQKVNPVGFRLGKRKEHSTVWFADYSEISVALKEDYFIRKCFEEKFLTLYEKTKEDVKISEFRIKRKPNQTNLEIHSVNAERVAYILSQEGVMATIKSALKNVMSNLNHLCITVHEVWKPYYESRLAARALARQLEKRVAFRRALRLSMKDLLDQGVGGVKIQISGRLNGVEIARSEWVQEGRVPLQTLRAPISFSKENAYTKYGVIGVKVWIFSFT